MLDGFMGGGLPPGDTLLVEGPSGTGKSVLATQFAAENAHQGIPVLVVLGEERPDRWTARGEQLGLELQRLIQKSLVEFMSMRGADICGDELAYMIDRAAIGLGARAVVLDSTAGLQLALGSALTDWLWRTLDRLTANGTTVWVNHTPVREPLGALFDNVIRLTESRLELTKLSSPANVAGLVPYHIGPHGVQLSAVGDAPPGTNGNGHILAYRIAANGR
jgi:hypothetical protein